MGLGGKVTTALQIAWRVPNQGVLRGTYEDLSVGVLWTTSNSFSAFVLGEGRGEYETHNGVAEAMRWCQRKVQELRPTRQLPKGDAP